MRRMLLWSLLTATALVLVLALVVNLRAGDASELPAPDAHLPIQLPGGEVVPLADLLARLGSATRTPVEPLVAAGAVAAIGDARATDASAGRAGSLYPGMPWGPVFQLAEYHRQADRLNQALALYQSIPEDDRDYARSRRRIAWDILTRGRGRPLSGVPFVHAALLREPLDANSWQDLARVYGATFGLDTDGWD